jgi:hypothetical protein
MHNEPWGDSFNSKVGEREERDLERTARRVAHVPSPRRGIVLLA